MQRQINDIVSENARFREEAAEKAGEEVISDRYFNKGDRTSIQYETMNNELDFTGSEFNQPRMLTLK